MMRIYLLLFIRWAIWITLLVAAWRHSHWSVALTLSLVSFSQEALWTREQLRHEVDRREHSLERERSELLAKINSI